MGMALSVGTILDLDTFQEALYRGQTEPLGEEQTGSAPDLTKTIGDAIRDAGLENPADLAVFLAVDGLAQESFEKDFSQFRLVLQLAGSSTSLGEILRQAGEALVGGAKAAVIAACQLRSGAMARRPGNLTLSFEQNGMRAPETSGCAAVVLDANPDKPVYAWIESYAAVEDLSLASAVEEAGRIALGASGHLPEEIGCIEVSGFGDADDAEVAGLRGAYQVGKVGLTCAVGSSTPLVGNTGCAAGLAGLVRTCLSVTRRFFPMVPNWKAPIDPGLWAGTPFYVPQASQTWFQRQGNRGRSATLNHIGPANTCTHVVLAEADQPQRIVTERIHTLGVTLIPCVGANTEQLLAQVAGIREKIERGEGLEEVAAVALNRYRGLADVPYALGLLGHNREEFLKEIQFAERGIQKSFETGGEWQTPMGSYLTAAPLGNKAQIAFVYPGAFNSYLGIGRDLFFAFPGLYDRFGELTSNIAMVLQEEKLYPRGLCAPTPAQLEEFETQLNENAVAMLTSGATLAVLYTLVLQEWFGIQPSGVFGYSLGEDSMLFASRVWRDGEIAGSALSTSPIFQTRITGPKETVREYWGLTDRTHVESNGSLWGNYILMAQAEQVYPALQSEERVYLTHINTPHQVVIGGDPPACQRVIQRVGCQSLKAPFDHVLHCEAMAAEFSTLVELSTWPIHQQPSYPLYSAADYHPLRLEPRAVGQSIAKMLCTPLDFPRLINLAYQDGARIFIELGAGSNCTRWIDDTLKGQPHASISINRKGLTDPEAVLRTLARLISHRIEIDFSRLIV